MATMMSVWETATASPQTADLLALVSYLCSSIIDGQMARRDFPPKYTHSGSTAAAALSNIILCLFVAEEASPVWIL